jgi:ABC transport system ATP-binding/permease protein
MPAAGSLPASAGQGRCRRSSTRPVRDAGPSDRDPLHLWAAVPRNLVNLNSVAKSYASRTVLDGVTLGLEKGERIGMVGENGAGKTTLLRLIAGAEEPDQGSVTRTAGVAAALVSQRAELDPAATVREALAGERADHEWAADPRFRAVLDGLLGGVALTRFPAGPETIVGPLSGGEQRRIALARSLIDSPQLLMLDEPTNHLDIEGIAWLAGHLAARRGALLVITHDRWFLDAVCERTWEVADGTVHRYEGGYSAYVLARAERDRQSAAREDRRRQLVRKELAWLRRGPPARTSKPKFRIDAANALIADEPRARDTVELLRFATARLGDRVIDGVDLTLALGGRTLLRDVTWRLGPGQRVALVGPNGAGKTSLLRVLMGALGPDRGTVTRGQTVQLAELSQHDEAPPDGNPRVLDSLEQVRGRITTSAGEELTAGRLAERFGFRGDKLRTRLDELSGGERRRLELMRVLMREPNVLILDEPTNDLDIDTLTALEDLLDSWPGTLVVVSHDRYFIERVCDDVYALPGDGTLRHLPGGIEQYLAEQHSAPAARPASAAPAPSGAPAPGAARRAPGAARRAAGADRRATKREIARIDRELDRIQARDQELHQAMTAAATDAGRLRELSEELGALSDQRDRLESDWLELSEQLEDA